MNRFFTSPESINGMDVELPKDISHQLAVVLRAKKGDRIIVMDGNGTELEVELGHIQSDSCRGIVVEERRGTGEPNVNVTLCQALIKPERFEYVLQKGVEVGVSKFVPFISARTDRLSISGTRKKRWHRIIREAAEQSGRCRIPDLTDPKTFHEALSISNGLSLIPWEKEKDLYLKEALTTHVESLERDISEVSVFVGPVPPDFIHDRIGAALEEPISGAPEDGGIIGEAASIVFQCPPGQLVAPC